LSGAAGDLDQEIRHHIQESADLLIAQGWTPEEALREAERRFGRVTRIREQLLGIHGAPPQRPAPLEWLHSAVQDARHALRGILTRPAMTLPLLLTLALGIGASAAVFSVVDAALLRPIGYRDAQRLVEVKPAGSGNSSGTISIAAIPRFIDAAGAFSDGWEAHRTETLVRTDGDAAEQLSVVAVTPGADTLLGIPLLMGRSFSADDARPGAPDVVILTRPYYERLRADADILGRTIRLESGPARVVGVLRGGVRFPEYGGYPDLWMPLRSDFTFANQRAEAGELWLRLRADVSLAAARGRAEAVAAGLRQQELLDADENIALLPVAEFRANRDTKQALWALSGTVAALYLIALVNAANLLLVRASTRGRELAVRMAIGGSRARLLRLLVIEGLSIGVFGGAAAAALAWAAVRAMRGVLPSELLFFTPHVFGVETRTIVFTLAASMIVGVTLGLVPAYHVLRGRRLSSSLTGRVEDAPSTRRLRNSLVVAQVTLSMALLAGAGLFVKSFVRLVSVDPGFDFERVALASIPLSPVRYPDAPSQAELLRRLEDALEGRPEVEGVAMSTGGGFTSGRRIEAEGMPAPGDAPSLIPFSSVSPDYLRVTGTELVAGRGLEPEDVGTGAVLIDQDFASYLWGGESVIGRRFRIGEDQEWNTVVGVVQELQLMGRDERDGPYQLLYPMDPSEDVNVAQLAVRSAGDPAALLPVIRETLRELDPEQWIWKLHTGPEALAEEEDQPRFLVTLMSLLATIAISLASLGLYGVLSNSVAQRNREIGIRVALGADCGRVRGLVVAEGLQVAGLGVLLGTLAALLSSRVLEQLLYEVEPGDPWTLAATAALFLAVAAAASLVPAARATRIDPAQVLKAE
jgi:predicted permease